MYVYSLFFRDCRLVSEILKQKLFDSAIIESLKSKNMSQALRHVLFLAKQI